MPPTQHTPNAEAASSQPHWRSRKSSDRIALHTYLDMLDKYSIAINSVSLCPVYLSYLTVRLRDTFTLIVPPHFTWPVYLLSEFILPHSSTSGWIITAVSSSFTLLCLFQRTYTCISCTYILGAGFSLQCHLFSPFIMHENLLKPVIIMMDLNVPLDCQ